MNIAQIMDLDVGMKGITCSGKITWANEAKNITGTSNGKDYDFWSQFIVVEDTTGKIGVSITVETDQRSVKKGDTVTVENGELKEYLKDGEPMLKLQGRLKYPAQNTQDTSQDSSQGSQQAREATNPPQTAKAAPAWQPLDREHVEKDVICALLAARNRAKPEDVKKWADYIMSGIHPDGQPQTQNNPEYVGDNPPKPKDDDVPW